MLRNILLPYRKGHSMYCSVSEWSLLMQGFKTDGKVKIKTQFPCNSNRKQNSGTEMVKDLYCLQIQKNKYELLYKGSNIFSFTAPPRTI
jgi:hypothetical protein